MGIQKIKQNDKNPYYDMSDGHYMSSRKVAAMGIDRPDGKALSPAALNLLQYETANGRLGMKKELYSAEEIINALMAEDRGVSERINREQADDPALILKWAEKVNWSPSLPYLAGLYGDADEVYRIEHGEGMSDPEIKQTFLAGTVALRVVDEWCRAKNCFVFTEEMEEALMSQKVSDISADILNRLPYNNFAIITSLKNFGSSISPETSGLHVACAVVSISEYNHRKYFSFTVHNNEQSVVRDVNPTLGLLFSGEYGFDRIQEKTIRQMKEDIDEQSRRAVHDGNLHLFPEFTSFFFNALLYLCSENAELTEKPFEGRPYRPAKPGFVRNIPREVHQMAVGDKFSLKVRDWKAAKKIYESTRREIGAGSPVSPHVRRAHWHHYWKGSEKGGDRRLALEWTEPVFIHKDLLPLAGTQLNIIKSEDSADKQHHLPIKALLPEEIEAEEKEDKALIEDLDNEDINVPEKDFVYKGLTDKKIEYTEENGKRIVRRNRKTSLNALQKAGYRCENNPSHETFIKAGKEVPYMEPHHLIPLAYQKYFKVPLDVEENIVCLCPNCHRFIHYGKNRGVLALRLFRQRKQYLMNAGIDIDENELLKMYGTDTKKHTEKSA